MSLHLFQSTRVTRWLLWQLARPRARSTVRRLTPYLRPGESILDIGAGICDITLRLKQAGHPITALDVEDYSHTPLIHPMLYDGTTMPFKNGAFDTALLLTVLHHIPKEGQLPVLREAAHVAKRMIITEDVYTTALHKRLTFIMDNMLNLGFHGNPHSNRTDAEWREFFQKAGLRVMETKKRRLFWLLTQQLYIVQAAGAPARSQTPEAKV